MCMGMIAYGDFHDETGEVIAGLNPGDEILINGFDENNKPTQEVATVWTVSGYSCLTTNGRPLGCGMGITIIFTGVNHKFYSVARNAREYVKSMEEQKVLENFDSEPE